MMDRGEYWKEVRSLAEDAVQECGNDEEAVEQWVWETIDGHQYIIYTRYNFGVLEYSDHAYEADDHDIIFDPNEQSFDQYLAVRAFYAMRADVMEQVESELLDWEEGEE